MHKEGRERFYAYLGGLLTRKSCMVFAIGGVEDHLHIVTHIHQTISVANLVKDLKLSSHSMIESTDLFPDFVEWQIGYAAFSYHPSAKANLVRYVKDQEAHHAKAIEYAGELVLLLEEHQLPYDPNFLV